MTYPQDESLEGLMTVAAILRCEQGGTPAEYDQLSKDLMETFPLKCAFVVRKAEEDDNAIMLTKDFSIYVKARIFPEDKRELKDNMTNFCSVDGLSITKVEFVAPRVKASRQR